MGQGLSNLTLAKPRESAKEILKTYELLIYGDVLHTTTSICKNVL
jgi:hypothetical protein